MNPNHAVGSAPSATCLKLWTAFVELLLVNRIELYRAWLAGQRKSRGGQWTDKPFTSFLELVLYRGIAGRLGLAVRSKGNGGEVSRVDASFYTAGTEHAVTLRDATIVLEHENKRNDQSREVEKLARSVAPLRALIFYTRPNARDAALAAISARFTEAGACHGEVLAIWGESEASAGPTYRGFRLLADGEWQEVGSIVITATAT